MMDYQPSDTLRRYCLKRWGSAFLPDAFLAQFLDHAQSRRPPYKSLDQALRNWIIRESPSARYYNARKWEAALARAKAAETACARARACIQQLPSPTATWIPAPSERRPERLSVVLARMDTLQAIKKAPNRV
jgi:hypothetical protein